MELHLFRLAVGAVLLIPGIAGPVGGYGGMHALARLLLAGDPVVPASLHNSLRAVVWMFFCVVPLTIWSLREMKQRAGAFRIVVACGFGAGLTRVTGLLVDGWPGAIPIGIMCIELGFMPVLFFWHHRLVKRLWGPT